jgi:hypothetical protein
MNNTNNHKLFLGILIAVIVVAVVIILCAAFLPFNSSRVTAPIVLNQPQITQLVTARGVDAQGNAVGVTSQFSSKKDKVIYAVMSLKNAIKTTKLAYIRFFNGKYIDSKVAVPAKDGAKTFYFIFQKGIGNYPVGNYRIVSYLNDKKSLDVSYSIK